MQAENLALKEEIDMKEEMGELWAEMFGKYNTETEQWYMSLDNIHDQLALNVSYMKRLSEMNLSRR